MCGRAFSSQMRHGHGMARNMPHDIIKPVNQRFTAIPLPKMRQSGRDLADRVEFRR